MTPHELSSEKEHFATSFIGSDEDFSTDLTLETYLEAISHDESRIQSFDVREADSAKAELLRPCLRCLFSRTYLRDCSWGFLYLAGAIGERYVGLSFLGNHFVALNQAGSQPGS